MNNKYFGLYRGTVIDNDDPTCAMRIKISVPTVFGNLEHVWASPCLSPGVRLVPEKGTIVWVAFEAGDPDCPVWVGTFGSSEACEVDEEGKLKVMDYLA